MTSRRGVSLIEVLVVITTGTIIVGLVVGMLRSLVVAYRASEGHLVRSEAVGRLSESFRTDVRSAATVEFVEEDGATRLALTGDDGRRIEFRAAGQAVIRIEHAQGAASRREKFAMPTDSAIRFEIQPDDETTTVILVITRTQARSHGGPSHEFHAVATLGRDRRFVAKGK
jgi:type II secretory pathway component PulJ